jgi:hypothetical protein
MVFFFGVTQAVGLGASVLQILLISPNLTPIVRNMVMT